MSNGGGPIGEGVDVEGLREYLAQSAVVFAVLFGSHARGTAAATSDVDIAIRFPETMDDHDRFHRRNQIDAALQAYADGDVDVSDFESLPTPVAYAALRDGILLAGDEQTLDAYRAQIEAEYEATSNERERQRREFIDRLPEETCSWLTRRSSSINCGT